MEKSKETRMLSRDGKTVGTIMNLRSRRCMMEG